MEESKRHIRKPSIFRGLNTTGEDSDGSRMTDKQSPFNLNLSLINTQKPKTSQYGLKQKEKEKENQSKLSQKKLSCQSMRLHRRNASWTSSKFTRGLLENYSKKVEFLNKAYSHAFNQKEEVVLPLCRADQIEKFNNLLEKASRKPQDLKEEEWNKVDVFDEPVMFRVNCENRVFPAFFELKVFTASAESKQKEELPGLSVLVNHSKAVRKDKTDFEFHSKEFAVKYSSNNENPMRFFFLVVSIQEPKTIQILFRFQKKLKKAVDYKMKSNSQSALRSSRRFDFLEENPKETELETKKSPVASPKLNKSGNNSNMRGDSMTSGPFELFPTQIPFIQSQKDRFPLEDSFEEFSVTKGLGHYVKMNTVNIKEFIQTKRSRLSTSISVLEERTKDAQLKKRELFQMKRDASLSFIKRPLIIRQDVAPL